MQKAADSLSTPQWYFEKYGSTIVAADRTIAKV